MAQPRRTTRKDWIEAGYDALGHGGLDGVSVEAIAVTLGVSKAGFYHRFRDRQELLDAIVERWFADADEKFGRHAECADPDECLRSVALDFLEDDRIRRADAWLLLHNPADAELTERTGLVREQTEEFCREQLLRLGFDRAAAAERAHLLYTGYLGLVADLEARPTPPAPEEVRRLVDSLINLFIAPARPEAH